MNISKEILKSLRGKLSAQAFSAKLGYGSNQFSRWESGHSRFSWSDFIELCRRLNFSIDDALAEYEFHGNVDDIQKLLSFFLPNKTKNEIAKVCKTSAITVNRWYKKQSEPSAELIFKLFASSGTPLAPLLRKLIEQKKMTSHLTELLASEQENISAMMENPWTIAIANRCLQTDIVGLTFENSIYKLSKLLGMNREILDENVRRLIRTKLLAYSFKENRFYLPQGPAHFEFRDSFDDFVRGARFWFNYTLAVMNNKQTPSLGENHVSYLVFNLRSEEIKNVHEKLIALYKELANLSQANEAKGNCDRTFSFCMGLNRIDGPVFGQMVTLANRD